MSERDLNEVVESLREGMRRQRAALAAADESHGGETLSDLEDSWNVNEPSGMSGRPVFGRLITFLRKVVKITILRWYTRPILQQQNLFNRAAKRRIEELTSANRRLQSEIDELRSRIESP